MTASGSGATACGGSENQATGQNSFVGGGLSNRAGGFVAAVVSGNANNAAGQSSFIGGGDGNVATGYRSVVPGGSGNTAQGAGSFAAGTKADAIHDGAFVWADGGSFYPFVSTAANEFSARCTGGARFVSAVDGTGNPTAGVQLAAGGGSWSSISDRNAKENTAAVDGAALLSKLATIPVATWNYKSQDASIRHIGPMAQDFYAAFGVGEDNKHITTIDADGVALAAIQELYRTVRTLEGQKTEIEQLRALMSQLQEQIETLKAQAKPAESR